jgi:hypothetical protein
MITGDWRIGVFTAAKPTSYVSVRLRFPEGGADEPSQANTFERREWPRKVTQTSR